MARRDKEGGLNFLVHYTVKYRSVVYLTNTTLEFEAQATCIKPVT